MPHLLHEVRRSLIILYENQIYSYKPDNEMGHFKFEL